jgi:hypothetical protein
VRWIFLAFALLPMLAVEQAHALKKTHASHKTHASKKTDAFDKTFELKRSAVASQEVEIDYVFNVDENCNSYGEIRLAVLSAPKSGSTEIRDIDKRSSFKQDNPRRHCNEQKLPAKAMYYKAKAGFRGEDHFRFVIVFHDGKAWVYNVEMSVWGPP